jgi:hypothetical protein
MILQFRETLFLMMFLIFPLPVLALIFNNFWYRFWLHFGIPWASKSMFWGDRFFDDFGNGIFIDFEPK